MRIKANSVDPSKASLGARGIFGRAGSKKEKNYFFTAEAAQRAADSFSSSSSSETSPVPPQRRAVSYSAPNTREKGSSDVDSDEELLQQARAATVEFLYPKETKPVTPSSQTNPRLEAYKQFKELEKRKSSVGYAENTTITAAATTSTDRNTVHSAVSPPPSSLRDVEETTQPQTDSSTTPIATTSKPPETVGNPLETQTQTEEDPMRKDFNRLLQLFAADMEVEKAQQSSEEHTRKDKPIEVATETYVTYRPPARTFHDAQQNALHQIYEKWAAEHAEDDNAVFVAADHASEAFTIASQTVLMSSSNGQGELSATPFTIEDLATMGRENTISDAVANEAQEHLDRFIQSVFWIERLIRDQRFVSSLAEFFYANHKPFFQHFDSNAYTETQSVTPSMTEHSHKEYEVYSIFSARASDVLWQLLSTKVEGFDEEEFAESLYSTPVTFLGEEEEEHSGGPQNILSFPAWRLILSISDFECFFAWMMDYIAEEYNLSGPGEGEVVVGGARGLRALIKSTYKDDKKATPPFDEAVDDTTTNHTNHNHDDVPDQSVPLLDAEVGREPTIPLSVSTTLLEGPERINTPPEGSKFKASRLLPIRRANKPPHHIPEDPSFTHSMSSLRDTEVTEAPVVPSSADAAKPIKNPRLAVGHHLPPLEENTEAMKKGNSASLPSTKSKALAKPSTKKSTKNSTPTKPASKASTKTTTTTEAPSAGTKPRKTSGVFFTSGNATRRSTARGSFGDSTGTPRGESANPSTKATVGLPRKPSTADGTRKKK